MFDVAPSELLLVALVALLVIGPKDLPKAMRVVGYWVGRARGVMGQVRSGFDSMMREAELKDLEQQWAKENERIMRDTALVDPGGALEPGPEPVLALDPPPVMTAAPVIHNPPIAPMPTAGASTVPPPTLDEIDAAIGMVPPQDVRP